MRKVMFMAAVVNVETCTGCGECAQVCPLNAIEIKDGKAVVDENTCGECGACVDVCPTQSITLP
jgi:ferredoxin